MTRHVPDPGDPNEPLLTGFNTAVHEHKYDIAELTEELSSAY